MSVFIVSANTTFRKLYIQIVICYMFRQFLAIIGQILQQHMRLL